jgi:two-component system chemotaxis sensor kinase CheA
VKSFERVEEKLARFRRCFAAGVGHAQHDGHREELLRSIQARLSHSELERLVRSYALEPVELRLRRAAEQVRALAARLGKGPVNVKVECDRIRAERAEWNALWLELAHVLRNAVDHGLEAPAERLARGKPEEATITLRAFSCVEGLTVEVEDQGAGIDWRRVESKARELGVLGSGVATKAALSDALFYQGLTTTAHPTETSGRGVGLAAIRDAVVGRGGRVSVESRLGSGTKFSFVWPASSIHLDRASTVPGRPGSSKDLPS